jgi:NifU-like protein
MSEQLVTERIELLKNAGYSRKAIDLFINEVNFGIIENAYIALSNTGLCGDACRIHLKENNQKVITEPKFLFLDYPACEICGSIVTQMVKGMPLFEAEKINEKEVIKELNGLPNDGCHCATLVLTTLGMAIRKFMKNMIIEEGNF